MALTITIPGAVEATIGATAPAILTVGVGVPGATGATGATGAQGPQGDPGEGVPVGGTAGQVLAKIDGTNYNTEWVNVEGDYVPLAGGTMDAGAQIVLPTAGGAGGLLTGSDLFFEDTEGNEALFSASSLSIGQGGGDVTTITGGKVELVFDDVALPFTIDVNGITFPDATVQTTAFTDSYVPLAGGTMTGTLYVPTIGNILNTNLVIDAYNDDGAGTHNYFTFNPYGGGFQLPSGSAGITFGNASVQTIAFPGFNNAALTGNPTAPTATFGDDDTSIATTAFVQAGLLGGTAVARNLEVYVRNQSGASIPAGSIVFISGATGNRPLITLSQANNDANSAQTMGFTKTTIANNAFGYVIVRGEVENLNTSALTEGDQLYLSPTVAGAYTTTKPVAPQHLVYVGIVIRSHPNQGVILVAVQNGYELGEIHDVLLTTPANNNLLAYESSTDLWKNKTAATLGLAEINSQAFTGTPSLPTGTTGVTQTAGNNTTALATTAFVTAAVPAFATIYQARDGTSTTLAVNPAGIGQSLMDPCYRLANFSQNAISGTGATVTFYNLSTIRLIGPTLLAGYSLGRTNDNTNAYLNYQLARGLGASTVSFAKPYIFSFRLNATTVAGNTIRLKTGQSSTNTGGDPTSDGFGIRIVGTGAVELQCFKTGPGLTSITSSFTPTSGISFDVIISSNNGTVLLYINDTLVATNTDGPTSAIAANSNSQIEVIGSGTQASGTTVLLSNLKIFNGP